MTEESSRAKRRRCLRCRSEFVSPHSGVRLCDPCRLEISRGKVDELDVVVEDYEGEPSKLPMMPTVPMGMRR